MQKLTTREPDDSMIETAIVALEPVLTKDGIVVQTETVSPRIYADRPVDPPPTPDQGLAPASD
jgi:hypothetical protein